MIYMSLIIQIYILQSGVHVSCCPGLISMLSLDESVLIGCSEAITVILQAREVPFYTNDFLYFELLQFCRQPAMIFFYLKIPDTSKITGKWKLSPCQSWVYILNMRKKIPSQTYMVSVAVSLYWWSLQMHDVIEQHCTLWRRCNMWTQNGFLLSEK